jgi:hypothetical protein
MNDDPKLNPEEEECVRWIDGVLSPERLRELEESVPPEWLRERMAARRTGDLLRSSLVAAVAVVCAVGFGCGGGGGIHDLECEASCGRVAGGAGLCA